MIKKLMILLPMFFLLSCSGIEFVLNENDSINIFKDKVTINLDGEKEPAFSQELNLFFGSKEDAEFILIATFSEKKENRLVKKNQVAEKVDYEIIVNYKIFNKQSGCNIFKTRINTSFSFVPKSFGYNFGTDRSFTKLYKASIKKNIEGFISLAPKDNLLVCL